MRVKICGITNLEDALISIDAGADALGFVFYKKSPRYISPDNAKNIINQLPPFVEKVGLFVENSSNEIDEIANETKISSAQLHWDIDPIEFSRIKINKIRVIRAKSENDLDLYKNSYRFVDSYVESFGGAGHRLNLDWFKNRDNRKIILAGGLNVENIDEVAGFGFYGVDVSSGVEAYRGKKDKNKVIEFIKKVKRIEN